MAGKRADGEGSIFQRKDGRWIGEVMLGYVPDPASPGDPTRRKRDVRRVSATTQGECRKKLDEVKRQAARGLLPTLAQKHHQRTVGDLLDAYLADAEARGLKPQTLAYYRQAKARYLPATLQAVRLVDLKPEHCQAALAHLARRTLSPTTIRNTRAVLNAALRYALRLDWIARNPAEFVRPPKRRRPALRPPTPEEMDALIEAAELSGDRLAALWTLAAYAGLRPGELLALRWEDLDLDAGTVTVRRTLTKLPGQPLGFGVPKSDSGRRTMRVAPDAVAALVAHKRHQAEERLRLGPDYLDHGLVFCLPTGAPLLPRHAVRLFKQALVRAKLPAAIRFYDLRHGNATAMLLAGVASKAAAERLGHSSVVLFNDTYAHVLQEIDADAAAKLQAVIGGRRRAGGSGKPREAV